MIWGRAHEYYDPRQKPREERTATKNTMEAELLFITLILSKYFVNHTGILEDVIGAGDRV